jgi:uncharacterized Zn finger protein
MARDPWFPQSGPRLRAKDGIAAKKGRGAIGERWWSRRFVAVLEAITGEGRLARGRSYARSGQVSELVVSAGLVTAKVQGSRPRPYDVTIAITPLSPEQWDAAEAALSERALFAAALLAGEMPHAIEDVFTALGTPLFPQSSRDGEGWNETPGLREARAARARAGEVTDLRSECSCPDVANPCKHVAAVYYLLAERFDDDPFAILAWRGRERAALIEALRARRTDEAEVVVVAAPEVPPAPVDPAAAWHASPEALGMKLPKPEGPADALIRGLGELNADGKELGRELAAAYAGIAERGRSEEG